MTKFDVRHSDSQTTVAVCVSAARAAALVQIDPFELEWAVEDCGVCEAGEFVIVPHGATVH